MENITSKEIIARLEELSVDGKLDEEGLALMRDLLRSSGVYLSDKRDLYMIFDPQLDLQFMSDKADVLKEAINSLKIEGGKVKKILVGRADDDVKPFKEFFSNEKNLHPVNPDLFGAGRISENDVIRVEDTNEPFTEHPDVALANDELELQPNAEVQDIYGVSDAAPETLDRADESTSYQPTADELALGMDMANIPRNGFYEKSEPATGVGSLISSIGSLIRAPFSAGSRVAKSGMDLAKVNVDKLNNWREGRPAKYLQSTLEMETDLVANLAAFRQGQFRSFEADVRSRDGWDSELSMKFEDTMAEDDDLRDSWKLICSQMRAYENLVHKTAELNRDNIEAVSERLAESASRVQEAGGPVPSELKLGMVKETIEEKSSLLVDYIKRFVARVMRRVFEGAGNVLGSNPLSPSP